ncbi:MAG TPA: serine hydrolase domain-containing protein [Verrucomicrobiae bacterium]|nr:serine hydrolase domain-containing protein [Verrucomicrobiae bacterium]
MFLGGGAAASLTPDVSHADTVDGDFLARHLQGTTAPGMAALIIRDFRAERELVTGVRRLSSPERVRRGDRWHLGSDAKAMISTMIARLVERGVLSWDRPLAEMMPQFVETMHEGYRDVTLPELLSHRAGLPRDLSETQTGFFNAFHTDRAPLTAQRVAYLDRALREAPAAVKRSEFSYSNTGYVLAAACAEHATDRTFEALMISEVFGPLRMRSISFNQYGGRRDPAGHRDGRIADQTLDTNPRMFAPAGGISMSLPDWGRFCIDQMRGEHGHGRLLSAESYRLLHAPQGDTGFAALGWGYLPSAFERRGPALFHAGSDGNWTAVVMLFPETGNGVLVASNAFESMRGDRAANGAMRAIVTLIAEAVSREALQ